MNAFVTTWGIAALATAGVIVRPWHLPGGDLGGGPNLSLTGSLATILRLAAISRGS